MAFAQLARRLLESDDVEGVLTRAAEAAVTDIPGCAMSSITFREDGSLRTVLATHEGAFAADQLQYQAEEGPCLVALEEPIVHSPSLPDPRWPTLGARPLDLGVHAVVSYGLDLGGGAPRTPIAGSLNAYALAPGAFDDEAIEVGLILAVHTSMALRAVGGREPAGLVARLYDALPSRDVIGLAEGILMERSNITAEAAFDVLRRTSGRLGVKLRDLAGRLVETGRLDGGDRTA